MADYKVVDAEKLDADLTGIADEVRTLADTDSKISLEAMTDNIAQANGKVDSQSEIIAQIKSALQGKAVSGGGGCSLEGLLNGTEPKGSIAYDYSKISTQIINSFFSYRTEITEVISEDATSVPSFRGCSKITNLYFPLVTTAIGQGLNGTGFTGAFRYDKMFPGMKYLAQSAVFNGLFNITSITLPPTVESIKAVAFNVPMPLLTTIYFLGTPTTIDSGAIASGLTSITDIYVPWSEGEVANAPWGATNATIHYNTQYDADGNPITA